MKYDIEFPNPFWLGIEIVESDDKLPSLGCRIELKFELPRGIYSYKETEIWFECSVIDEFLRQMKGLVNGSEEKAEFYDMDRVILYIFNSKEIEMSVHRVHGEKGSGFMEFKTDCDPDIIKQHIEHLEAFEKWW